MAILIESKQHLNKLQASSIYCGSEYIGTSESEFLTTEETLEYWDMHSHKNLYYFINWEDDNLYTEDGQKIEPAY